MLEIAKDLLNLVGNTRFRTVLADPPWQFENRTGKMAPEHKRLNRYSTMGLEEIMSLPVDQIAASTAHLYLWVPNALLPDGLRVMELEFIRPGKPTQNSFIERFNRTYREEVLDFHIFSSLAEVREITENWLRQYNEERPHEALGNLAPSEYLAINSLEVSTFDWR